METKFNKAKYDIEYRKKHKSQFNVDINKEEMQSLKELLKVTNLKKVDFLRKAIKNECIKNNILYFDRVAICDWCKERHNVACIDYDKKKLICRECANKITEHHKNLDGSVPKWYN